uniref:protein ZGRF1-like isoform X2 n=1 Tax=Ciona intestinalis TaxID=7719 RepID=UPI00089DAEE0|nr:protein ZGRF1-like isoform X2 [Ciona intestinalis]|eukprot:XP_018666871.1 protein ZGRF1-like isoform X2 [Ciona intestinalis]
MRRELFFPTHDDLSRNPDIPEPSTEVPTTFASVDDYRNIWRTVVKEHFNFKIWAACKQYHSSMRNADLSKSLVQSGVVYSYAQRQPVYPKEFMLQNLMLGDPPYCDHDTPCRMNRVKKEGPNIGRIFYSCARKRKCKFFKWAEVSKIKSKPSVSLLPSSDMVKINNERALASYLLQNDVKFFTGCALRRKSVENNEDTNLKETLAAKYLYLQLSREDRSLMNIGLKDSLWAVSTNMDFTEDKTELFQAILNKTTNSNEIVVQPVNSTSSRLLNEDKVVVMYVCKSALEFSYLRILQDDMNLPMVTSLLNMKSINKHGGLNFTGTFDLTKPTNVVPSSRGKQVFHIEISYDDMISLSTCYVKNYNLNEQQSKALLSLVDMLKEKKNLSQIFLLDGVVGSGKTFLLSVIIMYLIEVMSAGDGKSNKVKILVTGKSNSVVDCLFHQLRALGCERMVRIGNLENINRNLLPYSLHSLGGAQEHAKKLQKMLQSSKQSQPSNYHIQKSLELVRSGSTKRMLHKALVVGMTCDEINSPCVRSYKFPIVIMDNATETSELSTLLPLVEFGCEKLLLAGDSRCLTNHNSAFTQSLFSRIHFSIEEPIILTDHYRCHNQVIDVINNAFYNDVIIKALSEDRPRLVTGLPNFCLYDVTGKEEEKENDFINSHEATFVADIIRFLLSHGVPGTSIVVIATTKAQVKEVEMTLQEIEFYDLSDVNCIVVTTIDDYDGWETNVAIVTCVRTSGTNHMHDKIIPLLTRGRHHNLVVGNLRNLSTNEKWSSVIGLCKEKRIVQNSFQFKKMSSTRSLPFAPEVPFNAETIDDVIMKRETKNQSDASDSEDEVPLFCHKRKRRRIDDDVIIDDDEEMFAVDDVTKTDNDIIPFADDITKTSDDITKTTGDITTTDDITTSDNITKTTDVITTSDNISTTDDITKTAGDITKTADDVTKTSDHITTTDTVTTDEIIPTSNDNMTINTSPANDITTNDIISTR